MSPYFTRQIEPGEMVFLGEVEGEFRLPDPLPERVAAHQRRQRHDADLGDAARARAPRRARRRPPRPLGARAGPGRSSATTCAGWTREYDGYTLDRASDRDGAAADARRASAEICPDWRERDTFMSGPRGLMDVMEAHWEAEGDPDRLFTERFQPIIGTRRRRGRKRRHRQLPDHRLRGDLRPRRLDPRRRRGGRRQSSPTAAGWGSATPASASCEAARCATCGPARSTASRARRSGPASTPPRGEIEIDL